MDMHPEAKSLIDDYTREAARRSGLPEPVRAEGRIELQSHLVESATAKAKDDGEGQVMRGHVREAIVALGTQADVDAAFFAGHRTDAQEAGWGRRVGAFLIDFLIIGSLTLAVAIPVAIDQDPCDVDGLTKCEYTYVGSTPCFAIVQSTNFQGSEEAVEEAQRRSGINPLVCAAFVVITLGYFAILEATVGRTVGKMAAGIRVTRNDSTAIGFGQALGRNVMKAFGPLLLLDWIVGVLAYKPARLRMSDKAAGTRVVVTR